MGAAGELWWGATHLQEGLARLESRDSSDLMETPGLRARSPQPQPSAKGGCQAPARGPQGLRTQRCPFNHCGCKHIHHASPGTRPSRVQLPTRRPSTTLAVSHQGQGAGPWLVVPHGAAGRPPRHKGLQEQRAPASPLPGRELPVAEAAGAKQLRQHKSTVTAPERLSPGVRKNTS